MSRSLASRRPTAPSSWSYRKPGDSVVTANPYHPACAGILRPEAAPLGMRSTVSIYDQSAAVRLTGYILRDMNLAPKRLPPRQIHAAISAAKNELISPKEMFEGALTPFDKKIAE